MSVLDEILDGVRADLAERQEQVSLDELKETAAPRAAAARTRCAALRGRGVGVIAEVKRASPSRAQLADDRRPGRAGRATTRPAAPL